MSKFHEPKPIQSVPSIAWKNGGGTTRTLAVEPADAGLDNFLWRISIAEITSPGSFSSFDGADRSIMLWSGEGVILRSSEWAEHALTTPWEPFSFRGEDDVTCDLISGSTADLNLMLRRGKIGAELRVYRSGTTLAAPMEAIVILCAQGEISVLMNGQAPVVLPSESFLRISQVDADIAVIMSDINSVYICALIQKGMG